MHEESSCMICIERKQISNMLKHTHCLNTCLLSKVFVRRAKSDCLRNRKIRTLEIVIKSAFKTIFFRVLAFYRSSMFIPPKIQERKKYTHIYPHIRNTSEHYTNLFSHQLILYYNLRLLYYNLRLSQESKHHLTTDNIVDFSGLATSCTKNCHA